MDKRTLARKLKAQLQNCVGFNGDELATAREEAYNYYFQRARGDEVAGRSEIVSGDLSSMVESNLAEMIEPLMNKRLAEFCSYDAKDEEQAQAESDCINELLFKRQNGFIELTSSIKDALLVRNGTIKVFVDKRTHTQSVRRDNVDPLVVTQVLDQIAAASPGSSVDVHTFDPKKKRLVATLTKVTRKFRAVSVAPENFLVPKSWDRSDLDGCPFCAERHVDPRSTLIEYGFDAATVDELPAFNNLGGNTINLARLPNGMAPDFRAIDKSQDLIEWYECYVRMDDGNGGSELRKIAWSATKILNAKEDQQVQTELICYATGTCIINPHTFIGISLHDKLKSTQDSTTALTRGLMDNLNAVSKNRTAHLDGVVEEADVTDARLNGSMRVDPDRVQDVRMAITAFPVPDASGNILQNLQHMRQTRSEMGGAALDMASGPMQLNDRMGSQGLDRAYSVMERFARLMTRTIAFTLVRSMYLIAHDVLRTQWVGDISFKRGNAWVTTTPSAWPVRESVEVNLGASPGERARQSAALDRLMDRQIALAGLGMEEILVDAPVFYNALTQWIRVNDLDIPERYVLDPRSEKAQKAFAQKAIAKQQAAQKQDAFMQQAVALEQVRTGVTKYVADQETQFKYWEAALNAQIEEAKLTVEGLTKLRQSLTEPAGDDDGPSKKTRGNGAAGKPAVAGDSGSDADESDQQVES